MTRDLSPGSPEDATAAEHHRQAIEAILRGRHVRVWPKMGQLSSRVGFSGVVQKVQVDATGTALWVDLADGASCPLTGEGFGLNAWDFEVTTPRPRPLPPWDLEPTAVPPSLSWEGAVLPRHELDTLLAVARLYVNAFDPDERMSLPERLALQQVEDIVARSEGADGA